MGYLQPQSAPTKFLILSDTHAQDIPVHTNIPRVDVILHCGDLTELGREDEHRKSFELLCGMQAELKLVIAGNHDLTLDKDFCANLDVMDKYEQMTDLWTSADAKANDIMYLTEGVHTFTLANGTAFTVYASPYTPKSGGGWAFQYSKTERRYVTGASKGPIPADADIDIVMTHGPPKFFLDECSNGNNAGCEDLLRALRHVRPLVHCFGHIHEGYGAQTLEWEDDAAKTTEFGVEALQKEWVGKNQMKRNGYLKKDGTILARKEHTLLVNAAILDADHEPTRVPWLVDLELTRRQ